MIAVDQNEKSWLVRSAPTLPALRPAGGAQPRAVLLMMPGGEGRIGLRPDASLDTSPPRTSFAAIPRRLVDPPLTSGTLHVVAVDSPYDLGYGAQPEGGDPCRTGAHMYHRAEEEVAKILDDFIARHTPVPAAAAAR